MDLGAKWRNLKIRLFAFLSLKKESQNGFSRREGLFKYTPRYLTELQKI